LLHVPFSHPRPALAIAGTFLVIAVSGLVTTVSGIVIAISGYMVPVNSAIVAFLAQPDNQEFDGKWHGSEFA
jgi:hypothetical protein